MFLIPAVTGQAPGKKQSSNKRKSPEELKESDREYEKKRERERFSQLDRWSCFLLEPEDLFETISQAMLNAVDRDAVSGMGVVVHVIEKDKITTRTLKARMD